MKKSLRLMVRLTRRFGIQAGLALFRQLKSKQLDNIRIPGIKSPIRLRKNTSDVATFFQIFVNREYNIKFPENTKTIIDGGANVGLFTVLIKNKFPDAKVICVEPDPENFEALQHNVKHYENTFCENTGLWNRRTGLRIHDKYELGKWAMVVEETDLDANIQALSIGNLIEKYDLERIDILKLDIETSEKKVFLDNYMEWLPKVKMIVIELHDWMEPDCAKPFFMAINSAFSSYSFSAKGENTVIVNNDIP